MITASKNGCEWVFLWLSGLAQGSTAGFPKCSFRTGEGASTATLSRSQFDALVLGLPWQRLGDGGVITVL